MTGDSLDRTRKTRNFFSRSALVVFLLLVGCGCLAFGKKISGETVVYVFAVGSILIAVLSYLSYAVWKCPSCKKQMGKRADISYCPSCGQKLISDSKIKSLDDRVREFVSKSERPTSKEILLETLETKFTRRK